MITIEEVEAIHTILIEKFGGSHGIRDRGQLESALARPFQTFGGIELYPDAESKAAAIVESILINHPFIDGNKITGYVLMQLILKLGNKKLIASEEKKYQFIIDITQGTLRYDEF